MTGFKTDISKQGTKFELVFYTDNKDYFKKVQSVAEECIDHKPITQFDRIKAMSVEELAEYLYNTDDLLCDEICKHSQVDYVCPYADEPTKEMCINCVKKWLESEVQGE